MELLTYYVGQGATAVLRTDTEAIIIDAIFPSRADRDTVVLKEVLARDLADRNLSGLMLTSFDRDHADPKAVAWILNKYIPQWVMYPSYWKGSTSAERVMDAIKSTQQRRHGTPWDLNRMGVRLDKMSDRRITDLSENFDFEIFSPHIDDLTSSNNSSLVARITHKNGRGFSYLVTGDTEYERWESIFGYFSHRLPTDVMSAAHHGSKTGVHEESIEAIDPHTIIISCGIDNQYDHPDIEALEAFDAVNADVYCTGEEGRSFRTRKNFFGRILTEERG